MIKKGFIVLLFLIACWAITKSLYDRKVLDREGLYVVGKLLKKDRAVKGGAHFTFEYWYKKRRYECSFSGQVPSKTLRDSLIFIKLLPSNPNYGRHVDDIEVPWCIKSIDTVLHELPKFNYCYPD